MAEQPISDIERVRRMLAGDEAAFEQFFADAYRPSTASRWSAWRSIETPAAEVAPATVCKAIGKLHTFRGEATLLTWLCASCRHEVYVWTKRHGRVQVELLEDD